MEAGRTFSKQGGRAKWGLKKMLAKAR